MRYQPNSLQGHVCEFVPQDEWTEEEKEVVELPNIVLAHKVIVVGKVAPHWVYVATITSTVDETLDPDLYVPILPVKKNPKTNMQLKLSHDMLGLALPLRSHLRVHELHRVPRSILSETLVGCRSESLELKAQSYRGLQHFLKLKGKLPQ